MKAVSKIITGAVGLAALTATATPAAAQYYPSYNSGGGIVGQVLNTILNPYGQQAYGANYGGNYGVNSQMAVQQCSAAVQQRLGGYGGGYSPYGGGYGYNPYGGYANVNSSARIVAISGIEPRSANTFRVRGLATSGAYGGYPAAYGGGYAGYGYNAAASADLSFKCDIDYRGYIRDVDIDRRY